jgi:hypothetical protein
VSRIIAGLLSLVALAARPKRYGALSATVRLLCGRSERALFRTQSLIELPPMSLDTV